MGLRDRIRPRSSAYAYETATGSSIWMDDTSSSAAAAAANRYRPSSTVVLSGSAPQIVGSLDEARLGKIVNIAFCGASGVGKSKLINGLVGRHIAQDDGKAKTHPDGHRYNHPRYEDVSLFEININFAAKTDFRTFHLVVIVFNHSVGAPEVEGARRAAEANVPVIYVCTRADMQMDRFIRIAHESEVAAVSRVRQIVNSRADKGWFRLPEPYKNLYIVSAPALQQRTGCYFDELKFVSKVESYYTLRISANVDLGGEGVAYGVNGNDGSVMDFGEGIGVGGLVPVRQTLADQEAKERSGLRSSRGARNSIGGGSPMKRDFGAGASIYGGTSSYYSNGGSSADVKIGFLEDRDASSTMGPTLMESLLGFSAGGPPAIVPNTPYKHPEYPRGVFYLFNSGACPPKRYQSFFVANGLSHMRLLVVVFTRSLREVDILLAKEARKFGVDVIVAHRKLDDKIRGRGLRPRLSFRRFRELSPADIQSQLGKHGLDSITTFVVNPRILRIPDSFPKTDEESFKEYIAGTCGGRGSPPNTRAAGLKSEMGPLTGRAGGGGGARTALDGSLIFGGKIMYPAPTPPPDGTDTPNTKRSSRYGSTATAASRDTAATVPTRPPTAPTTPSVHFICRSDILVAFVGPSGCGKSTLIRNTLGIKQYEGAKRGGPGPVSVRHPAFYDLMIQDYPGYDPNDLSVGTSAWMHQLRLHTMDWIVIVFEKQLTDAELAIAEFAVNASIFVIFVATKVDQLVDDYKYDQRMLEKAAIEHTRFTIFHTYRGDMQKAKMEPLPLFLVCGRFLNGGRSRDLPTVPPYAFDEQEYLNTVETRIARTLYDS